ncbi:unnamed protein product, partial [Didymodactylos carnosus]
MKFTILSNSYFDPNQTSLLATKQTLFIRESLHIGCSRICLSTATSCQIAVYNGTDRTCSIYNTRVGIQRAWSSHTTFIVNETSEPLVAPVQPPDPKWTNVGNMSVQ